MKKVSDEKEKEIQEAVANGNIEFAESDKIEALGGFGYEVDNELFGVKGGFISNLSCLSDFVADPWPRVYERYGITKEQVGSDFIVDLLPLISTMEQ